MKKKWGIIDYLVIATIIIILLATSWTEKGKWILSTEDGTKRAVINVEEPLLDRWSELLSDPQETLDITLYPDGKREIRLSAYDHFSPPRYDALPFANATVGKNVQRFLLNVSPMNVLPEPENVSLKWT